MRDFPPPSEYAKVLSTPEGIRFAFRDPLLKAAKVELNAQLMPRVRSGAFAVVYKMILPDGRSQAVRLFLKDGDDRRERYALIHEHLAKTPLPCLVTFTYADDAFRAGDCKRYPMMTMDWVEGETLFDWLQDRVKAGDTRGIAAVAVKWREVVGALRRASIAHGDLQHANVMVTTSGDLKLVDYDGMCVPKLVGRRNLELGVDPYQHPGRNDDTTLTLSLDNFSTLVIQTCLSALAAEPALWADFVVKQTNEKILFRREDFENPTSSPLFQRLRRSRDPQVQKLAAVITDLWKKRIDQVPSLEDVLGTFDFAQVRTALDKREFDVAVGLLERNGKQEADAPTDLKPRIRDAIQRTAKFGELMRAVEAGNEAAMPALAASPLLRDYPAAAAALAVARESTVVTPVIARLEAAVKARRWRDLVREWDASQATLTRPTGALRKSAVRFVNEVRQWRDRNAACDRVIACLRQTPSDPNALATAWRMLLAVGGHPECDAQRAQIESIIKAAPAVGKPAGAGPVNAQPAPSAPQSPISSGGRSTPGTGSRSAAGTGSRPPPAPPASTPGAQPPPAKSPAGVNPGRGTAGPAPLPTPRTTPSGNGGESRLRSTSREFASELGKATHSLLCRWIPPFRWVSEHTPWDRLDGIAAATAVYMACGAAGGGLVGMAIALVAIRGLATLEPSYTGSMEWVLWRGSQIMVQIAGTVIGGAIGLAVARNRLFRRPGWRIREVGRSVVAGLGGGLLATGLGVAIAMSGRRSGSSTGGEEGSWAFVFGWTLVAFAGAAAMWWFSSRVVPNVSRAGSFTVSLAACCLSAIVVRLTAMVSGGVEWFPLISAAAVGAATFGIGLALAEALSHRPYLQARWSDGRNQRLNLGPTPVAVGSDAGRCDIITAGQIPLALRYWIDSGQCYVLDYATGQPARVGVGDQRSLGTSMLTITVPSGGTPAAVTPPAGSRPAWVSGGSLPASGARPVGSGTRPAGAPGAGSRGPGGAVPGPPPPPPPPRPTL